PATRSLYGVSTRPPSGLEGTESIQYLPQQVIAWHIASGPLPHHLDRAEHDQVCQQHAHHADRKLGPRRDVGHRGWLPGEADDLAVLWGPAGWLPATPGGGARRDHHGDQVKYCAVGRLGPAAGHRVGTDDRTGLAALPAFPRGHSGHPTVVSAAGNLACCTR